MKRGVWIVRGNNPSTVLGSLIFWLGEACCRAPWLLVTDPLCPRCPLLLRPRRTGHYPSVIGARAPADQRCPGPLQSSGNFPATSPRFFPGTLTCFKTSRLKFTTLNESPVDNDQVTSSDPDESGGGHVTWQ